MNKFKRFCLLLCCSLVCLNGFLPVVSYAYNNDFLTVYTIKWASESEGLTGYEFLKNGTLMEKKDVEELISDRYVLGNDCFSNIDTFRIGGDSDYNFFNFIYLPEVYDYYVYLTNLSQYSTNETEFSFCPNQVRFYTYPCNVENGDFVNIKELKVYHHDNKNMIGHTLVGKLDSLNNTMISWIDMIDDDGGSVPKNIIFRGCIVAVDKNYSSDINTLIVDKLNDINTSINQQGEDILTALDKGFLEIKQAVEDQYSVSEEENFGVEDIVDQVNEKAGVLSFGTDTLVNFLDLFDSANATNTKLTFPGFSMKIQGVDYQVWPVYHYDLSELENQFGALIEVVRWGCVMVVWLAVLNYLVKAYDTIFGR